MRALPMLALALAACASEAAAPVIPDAPRLELGTGTARFTRVEDGDVLPMVHGAQGGWHVWVAVRAEGMDVELSSLRLELQPADESGEPVVTESGARFDPADADGRRVSLGWAAIFPDPACAVGRLHRVHVTLTTARGERIEAERDVMPSPGEFPPPACEP